MSKFTERQKKCIEKFEDYRKKNPEGSINAFLKENHFSVGTFYLAKKNSELKNKSQKKVKTKKPPKPTYQVLEAKEVAEDDKLTVVIGTISSIKKLINL